MWGGWCLVFRVEGLGFSVLGLDGLRLQGLGSLRVGAFSAVLEVGAREHVRVALGF